MASFHSALSLVVLALISSCFAVPVPPNPSMETSSPFEYDMTTREGFGERTAFDDVTMSSTDAGIKRSADGALGLETFSTERMMTEDITRDPRTLNEMVTGESFTFTPTTEYSHQVPREMKDSFATASELTTERLEADRRGLVVETPIETGSSHMKREFSESEFTTLASSMGIQASEQLRAAIELTTTGMPMEFTTEVMPSFTSTSSAVAPELYTAPSFTTQKYTGLLGSRYDLEEGTDNGEKPKKPYREPEEEGSEDEKHKPLHGKDEEEKPHKQHDKEGSGEDERKPMHGKSRHDEEENTHEHHDKEGTEGEEPKPKHEKNNYDEEQKPHKYHDKQESAEEKPKPMEGEDVKPHEQHDKEGEDEEKPKPKPGKEMEGEDQQPHGQHYKEGEDEDKPKPKAGQYNDDEDKKYRGSYRKDENETKEPAHEGGQGTEEERRPEKQSAQSFEATDRKDVNDGRLIPSRRPNKAESDDDTHYPKAIYDQEAWKSISRLPSDFAVLDETSDVVTVADKSVERPHEESKLNQGEESSRAD